MRPSDEQERKNVMESLRASLLMLCFGGFLLAYLIAIDRQHWFALRPASGTVAALSDAANPIPAKQETAAIGP